MNLGSTKEVTRRSWDEIPIPGTIISQVNALGQGQPNDLELFERKKCPIGELKLTGVDAGETDAPNIELV